MPPASRNLPRVTYSFVLHVPFSHISEVCVYLHISLQKELTECFKTDSKSPLESNNLA